jgi:hypothetical protein
MKLILCPDCHDIVRLRKVKVSFCECKQSWGNYEEDGLNAVIGGKAIPLGFANGSFAEALRNQPSSGMGERFEAFVIPKKCASIRKSSMAAPTPLKTWFVHLWDEYMVFVAPSQSAVVDHLLETGYVSGIGPMDLGERIWELPSGGYEENQVTLICHGDRKIGERLKGQETQKNLGAGI